MGTNFSRNQARIFELTDADYAVKPFPDHIYLTVAAARAAGLSVVLATYPYPTREVEAGLARPEAFGAWLGELAQRYPTVRQFVVACANTARAMYASKTSVAVHTPRSMRSTISVARMPVNKRCY